MNFNRLIKPFLCTLFLTIGFFSEASVIEVQNTNDEGAGSLRQAVRDAVDTDTIRFNPNLISGGNATIFLDSTINYSGKGIIFKGLYNSTDTLKISGSNTNRIFTLLAAQRNVFDSLVLVDGNAAGAGEDSKGGAIFITNGIDTIFFNNSFFYNNNSLLNGGAIHNVDYGSELNLSFYNCDFKNNISGSNGGALYLWAFNNSAYVQIDSCTFENNTTDESGGAIFLRANTMGNFMASLNIQNSKIIDNSLNTGAGGAICLLGEDVDLLISYSEISGNGNSQFPALTDGGAIYVQSDSLSEINIDHSELNNNQCLGNGGAIFNSSLYGYPLTVIRTSELNNNSAVNGAVVSSHAANDSSFVHFVRSTVVNNNASQDGGVFYADGKYQTKGKIVLSTIVDNSAEGNGGVFTCVGGAESNVVSHVWMSTFYGNSAMGNGAISYIVTPDIATTLRSCIVIENSGNEQFYNENSVTSTLVPLDVTEYNIFGNEPAGFDVLDQINVSTAAVNLLPLAFNGTGVIGAVTRTMLPGPGSVAIDAADPTNIGIAQNGPTYGVRDIGAAEACIDISSTISVHACETYTVPSGDETYTVNGTYLDTITRVCGADSIITIELFIGTPETSSNDSTICIGSDFIFPDGVLIENVTSTMSHESILTSIYGCDSTVTTTVYVRALPTMSTIVTNATCGDENGSIDGTISGDGPFDIYWSNGDTIVDIIELFASTYYATITDVHGCQNVVATSVTTSGLDVSGITTENACPGLTSGSIDLTIVGDDAPFIIQWSNGSDQEDIENLGAGNYEVLVTDDNGCISSASFDIIDPDEIDVEFVVSDAGCGLVNGAVDATITGGTFGYTFSWRDETNTEVSTNEDLTGADEGNYSLTVSDLNGCLYSDFVSISESGAPTLSVNSITTASCNNDGAIDLNITSGEAINSITWSNLETTEDISGLSAGSYAVSVENASNCVSNLTVNVPTSAPIPVEICLVTVDTLTNTNKVIWEKPVSTTIDKFIIYRESSIAGQYLILDTVDYADESEYTDLGAFPQLRSWRYKLATLNTCGVKSALSPPHKTIHMVISQFGGDVSVQWDNYQGFSFATYNIYRYNAETGWNLWQQIPNNLFSVTDDNPQGTDVNYVVEAVPTDPCVSEKVNSYGETRSNRQNIAGALQSAPVADFSGDNTTILSGETVTFTDESAANPSVNQWSWTFEGGTPAASIDQSPTIEYATAGVYEVELIAINTLGRDTVTKTGYITVGDIGIDELPGINSLLMFPNPAKENVWISFNTAETQNITLELMTLDGKLIKTQNISGNGEVKTQIDLSNVSKATYLLRIRTNEGSLMKRLVKQ